MMRRNGNLNTKQDSQMERIEVAARRASGLCEQMLTYAGQGGHNTETMDVNAIIGDTLELLQASISKSIELKFEPGEALPVINANPSQWRQIVMNLVINATDAIGTKTGRITLQTEKRSMTVGELNHAISHPQLDDGDYVMMTVTDTGKGIAEENAERIFEPFFSTKFHGRGAGPIDRAGHRAKTRLKPGGAAIMDKGYDSDAIRESVNQIGGTAVIAVHPNRSQKPDFDEHFYRDRHRIENLFAKLKHFRRIATRYKKLLHSYAAMLALVCIIIWIKH